MKYEIEGYFITLNINGVLDTGSESTVGQRRLISVINDSGIDSLRSSIVKSTR